MKKGDKVVLLKEYNPSLPVGTILTVKALVDDCGTPFIEVEESRRWIHPEDLKIDEV